MNEQLEPQTDASVYQDAEIVDYGSASDIVETMGSGAINDGSGFAIYSS